MPFANCLLLAIYHSPAGSLSLSVMPQLCSCTSFIWILMCSEASMVAMVGHCAWEELFRIDPRRKTDPPLGKSAAAVMLVEPAFFGCCSSHNNVLKWVGMYSLKNLNDMRVCTWNKVPNKPHSFHFQHSSITQWLLVCLPPPFPTCVRQARTDGRVGPAQTGVWGGKGPQAKLLTSNVSWEHHAPQHRELHLHSLLFFLLFELDTA